MKFKDFYLLKERAYFTDVLGKVNATINKLEKKLSRLEKIESGTKVEVDGVVFILYKGVKQDAIAKYMGRGVIKIYLSQLYGDTKNFNYLKKGIPHQLRGIISHELTHNEEESGDTSFGEFGILSNYDEAGSYDYYNSDTEVNARIIEKLTMLLDEHIIELAQNGEKQKAFRMLLMKLDREGDIQHLDVENKKRLLKIMYTTFNQILDK